MSDLETFIPGRLIRHYLETFYQQLIDYCLSLGHSKKESKLLAFGLLLQMAEEVVGDNPAIMDRIDFILHNPRRPKKLSKAQTAKRELRIARRAALRASKVQATVIP